MLNKIFLIGRLTKDSELRYTPSGKAVTTFTLAVDRVPKLAQGQSADFINIVTWGKTAEACANYIGKGSLVCVEGRLQIRSYDGKDGQRRWATEVIGENVRFLDRRGETKMEEIGQEVEFSDDEIPF